MTEPAESIISDELRGCIGQRGPVRPLEPLSASDVRRYVDATGDANPLWLEDEFAPLGGLSGPSPAADSGGLDSLQPQGAGGRERTVIGRATATPRPPGLHQRSQRGQRDRVAAARHLGELLSCQSRIVDITAREGKMGVGIYVTQVEEVRNGEGELVFTRRHTVVLFPERTVKE